MRVVLSPRVRCTQEVARLLSDTACLQALNYDIDAAVECEEW